MSVGLEFDDISIFSAELWHWGAASRGNHGPRGLGAVGIDAERMPDWSEADTRMESLIVGPLRENHGNAYVDALVIYHVRQCDYFTGGVRMRMSTGQFRDLLAQAERYLFDYWRADI